MKRFIPALVACLAAPWLAWAQTSTVHVSVNGTTRDYRYHLPADRNPYRSPLVIALCGTETGTAAFEQFSHLDRAADDEGFVVVYPQPGAGGWRRREDVSFVDRVMRDAVHRWFLDWHRIYAVGFSNGGVLTYSLGQEMSKYLAGVACVAANMRTDQREAEPQNGLSLMVINGTQDPLMPDAGGTVSSRLGGGEVLSSRNTVLHWASADECDAPPPAAPLQTSIVQDGMQVDLQRWRGGRDDSEVAWYRVEGSGHSWPGASLALPTELVGPQCHEFDAASTVWQFLKSHQRALSTD